MPAIIPFIPLIAAVAAPLAQNLFAPDQPGLPTAPEAAPLPSAPTPATAEQPVRDIEASRLRADQQRRAAAEKNIFSLTSETTATTLTKNLLGE